MGVTIDDPLNVDPRTRALNWQAKIRHVNQRFHWSDVSDPDEQKKLRQNCSSIWVSARSVSVVALYYMGKRDMKSTDLR
jgi:hypothetical protein